MTTYTYLLTSQVGQPNGACPLGAGGEIDAARIDNIPAAAMESGVAINGLVLTADGSGGASYASLPVPDKFSPFLLMGT